MVFMAWKNLKQRSLADSMLIDHDALKELDSVRSLRADIARYSREPSWWKGMATFINVQGATVTKVVHTKWPSVRKKLARGLLSRRFVALDIAESVPDHSSFWRFRQTLERLSLMDKLLSEINAQLSSQGLYIKSGGASIVDASVVEAKQCRPN